jgi:hypothetical protein
MKINIFFCGLVGFILYFVICIFFKTMNPTIPKYGKVIDKYKGRSSSRGGDPEEEYYSDNLYLVFQYPNEPIDRQSVDPDEYYKFNIGDGCVKQVENGMTFIGKVSAWDFFISIGLMIIGIIRGFYLEEQERKSFNERYYL